MARESFSGYATPQSNTQGNSGCGKKKKSLRYKLRSLFLGNNKSSSSNSGGVGVASDKVNSEWTDNNVSISNNSVGDHKMSTSTASCPPDILGSTSVQQDTDTNGKSHVNKVIASGTISNDQMTSIDASTTTFKHINHEVKPTLPTTTPVRPKRPEMYDESLKGSIITQKKSNTTGSGVVGSVDGHKKHHRTKKGLAMQKFASVEMQKGYENVPLLDYTKLPRGGISLDTKAIGRIQYGIPPETIKDSMRLGLDVPIYYIVPVERFCREVGTALGVNLAEFEFPAYFNFFVKKLRCTLIVDSDGAESNIKRVFGETLLGPIQFRRSEDPIIYEEEDFSDDFPKENIPNFMRELKHFRIMPDGSELVLETLLDFRHFVKSDKKESGKFIYETVGLPESIESDKNQFEEHPSDEGKDNDSDVDDDDDDDDVMKNWSFVDVVSMAEVATIWPPKATPEEIAARSVPRVEVFKMPGGSEYVIHDIDSNNKIIGRAKIAGNVRVSDSMSVEGFEYLKKVPHHNHLITMDEEPSSSEDNNDSSVVFDERSVLPPTFHPPSFGVTVLGNSHGFDKSGSTSGYVLWINGRGVMIDPPPYSSATLEREGIRSRTIVGIILTHCHADHDAGAFQKVLTGSPVVVITTPTIYKSFIRKYAALSNLSPALLRHSHRYKPAIIGQPLRFQGATLHFSYMLHSIPCVGFRVEWRGRSMVFTGDHFNNPEGIDKLIDSGVMTKGRGEDLKALPLQETNLLLHEAGAPPIHTPLSVLMALPPKIKNRLFVVHTSALPPDCDLRVAPTGTAGTIRLDDHLIPSPTTYDKEMNLRVSTFNRSNETNHGQSYIVSESFKNMYDYDMLSESESYSNIPRSLPLVSLRPTSSTDAWFILNLLSAVPFLTSLSYVTTMEVLETARVDTFCMNDIVVPASRRRDVLCVVWEGTCMEREAKNKKVVTLRTEGVIRRTSTLNLDQGSHEPLTNSEINKHKKRPVAVWHAGDWTGPRSVQPDKKLSGESTNSETHDIVAMSSQGIKAINIEFSNLHSILKSGSELYRKYLARKHRQNDSIQFASNEENTATDTAKEMFDSAIKNLSIVELLEANSALKKLSAVQKRHFECLAEGPVYFSQGQRLWRSGTVVDKAYLIVRGTAIFLAGRRNARTLGSAAQQSPTFADNAKIQNIGVGPNNFYVCDLNSSFDMYDFFANFCIFQQRRTISKDNSAIRLVKEEEENEVTEETNLNKSIAYHRVSDHEFLSDTEKVKKELGYEEDSSLSDDYTGDGSFGSGSVNTFDLDNSLGTCGGESADIENLKILVKGFKNRADHVNSQPMRRTSGSSTESTPKNKFDSEKAYNDRVANKVLGRLYTRKRITSNLVFSRGHFLGDVSKMVAGLLTTGEAKTDDSSGDDESFKYGYGDIPAVTDSHAVATIHEREGDEHIVHNSTLVAGKDGCVVLIFPKSKICPFLDEYPGLLLSLLGTQVVV